MWLVWARWTATVLGALTAYSLSVSAQCPPQSEDSRVHGTSFLDHNGPVSGFWGQSILKNNIPWIDIPDSNIQAVYYYRWSSLARHLRYAQTGYVLTEFIQPVPWAQTFQTINAAAGHHIDETRWMRSRFYLDDYVGVYSRGPGNSLQYSHWIIDAAYRRAMVTGDTGYLTNQLNDMVRLFQLWKSMFNATAGLYYIETVWDAQEFSLPGYVQAAAAGNNNELGNGPLTYRPSLNAYMVANAQAIAAIAQLAGNSAISSQYTAIANNIQAAMFQHLWDPAQNFFVDVIQENNPNLSPIKGREEVGLYPFRFGIGLDSKYSSPAISAVLDPNVFNTAYGPATLEIKNQYYIAGRPSCCFWNGQSWPFSTAHSLKSVAAIARSSNPSATALDYYRLLSKYASTQYKNGVPYVAEQHFPDQNAWSGDHFNHSDHYDHSTYTDDVLTGLLGIVPRSDDVLEISPLVPASWTYYAVENVPYHGHLITFLYDSDGSRYKVGSGLTVYVDNSKIFQGAAKFPATISLPSAGALKPNTLTNIAANPIGLGAYPQAKATYTFSLDYPYKAIDGLLFYDREPDNRWTNYQSTSFNGVGTDTVQVTFARPRTISSVTLAIFADHLRGGKINVPASIRILGDKGLLATAQNSNTPFVENDKNTFTFAQVETAFVAVEFTNQAGFYVGVCELEVWVPQATSPYYAVDAYLIKGATVTQDGRSKTTSNGAVVNSISSGSVVSFTRVVSTGGVQTVSLSFSNSGSSTVQVGIFVNQVQAATVSLAPTGGAYNTVTIQVSFAAGSNYIDIRGGAVGVNFETMSTGTNSQLPPPSSTSN